MLRRPPVLRALAVALLAGSLTLPAGVGSASASVGVDQSYQVPASGVLGLRGHGYGHGHGMSQYGAYGAAQRGLGYRQIIDFYYPGTTWAKERGSIRVLVGADTTPDTVVSVTPGLRVRDLGTGRTYRLPTLPGVTRWRLNIDHGRTVVGYDRSGWHRYRPGGLPGLAGDGELSAPGPLTLWTPSGTRTYRGALRGVSPRPGSADRDTVDVVSLDDYVQGVIPSEMPASWSTEAVKAQAVAARTYATWSRDLFPDRCWQICDTAACQVYRGVDGEDPRANAAVAATAQQILTYQGGAAFTQFGSSSGGWLSEGNRPYLVARVDPYDDQASNPSHDWSTSLSAARVSAAYPALGRLRRLHVTRRDGHGQWGGRVVQVVLDGTRADVTLSGDTFRAVFGLRSTWFAG